MKTISAALLALLLAACAINPPAAPPEALALPPNANEIMAGAKVCPNPIAAKQKVSAGFKYGCFCGKGHPTLRSDSDKDDLNLPAPERAKLVEELLAIGPVDAIDAACQNHDICWTRYGRSQLSCNKAFIAELKVLRNKWNEQMSFFEASSVNFRCQYLARDISFAAMTLMQYVTDDQDAGVAADLARLLTLPITALYAANTAAGSGLGGLYPAAGELCAAP